MRNVFADDDRGGAPPADSRANPPFETRHLRAIELALRKAWTELRADRHLAARLSTEPEVIISLLLRNRLNQIRERDQGGVPGYQCEIFDKPQVGAEIEAPDGRIRKPDIVLNLCGRRRPGVTDSMTDAIFVECKILEQGKRNVALYCREGLHRFVTGAYAAWMREAMMVAYVRTSQSLPDALATKTGDPEMRRLLDSDGTLTRCTISKKDPRIYISEHKRNWTYPDGGLPGPIKIRHLWLRV